MYAQKNSDGTWRELHGNVVFSANVYQTAESLTDAQRVEFGVYPVEYTQPPSFDENTETVERTGFVFNAATQHVRPVWVVRKLTAEERRARVPASVTMRQGRLAMLATPFGQGTLLDVIESMLAAIPDPIQQRAAKIDWEYAQEIKRDFPLVQQLTAQLGLTEEQIDTLFMTAANL